LPAAVDAIEREGFALLQRVYSAAECAALVAGLEQALANCSDDAAALRRRGGSLYGARNVLQWFPAAREMWRRQPLTELLRDVLGPDVRLVRGLYFDKPPTATWSLPWHRDLTIAVRDNSLPSTRFTHPTRKAGVPHVEAPREVLEQMLTLRIHLDPAVPENGPLQVLPGSHRVENPDPSRFVPQPILSAAGDVLAMRPLLSHCSGASQPGTLLHRRVLHLEFTGLEQLPDGYEWASES
jgi:hypothetical protein